MTEQELDALMCRVLWDAFKLDCEREEEADENADMPVELPARHRRNMEAMLRDPFGWARRKGRSVWAQLLRQVAVAVLVLALGFGCVMAASPTVRAAVVKWIVEFYEDHFVYRYYGEAYDGTMPYYYVTWGEGKYKEVERIVTANAVSVLYDSGTDGLICFDYNYLYDSSVVEFVPENSAVIEIAVKRAEGQVHIPHDLGKMKTIIWIDERVNMQFRIVADFDEETMIAMAESVCIDKNK